MEDKKYGIFFNNWQSWTKVTKVFLIERMKKINLNSKAGQIQSGAHKLWWKMEGNKTEVLSGSSICPPGPKMQPAKLMPIINRIF